MFTQRVHATQQTTRKTSSTQMHRLGTIAETADGKVFKYTRAGASNLTRARLMVNADLVADHTNIVVSTAAAIGAVEISATLGATAATLDQYKDGYLTVNDATGEGFQYNIKGNSAAALSTAVTVKIYDDDPLLVALTTSSEVTLKKNTYDAVVISATDQADQPVGVATTDVTAAYYFWLQVGGEASVLNDASTVTKGLEVTISAATAGAVGLKDAAGEAKVGFASEALVSTEHRAVYLTLV